MIVKSIDHPEFEPQTFGLPVWCALFNKRKYCVFPTMHCFQWDYVVQVYDHEGYLWQNIRKKQDWCNFWSSRCTLSLMTQMTSCTIYQLRSNVLWEVHSTIFFSTDLMSQMGENSDLMIIICRPLVQLCLALVFSDSGILKLKVQIMVGPITKRLLEYANTSIEPWHLGVG